MITKKGTKESGKVMASMAEKLLSWYKDKKNSKLVRYYVKLESDMPGRGTGMYYKHLSQVFEIYMEILSLINIKQEPSGDGENVIKNAYQDLGTLIRDLLSVLISEQESENYD